MCESTYAGARRQLEVAERSQLARALRERGLQLTLQREAIYEAILTCPGHVCAEHVLDVVSQQRPGLQMNKTTVYRTVDLLVELGFVIEHKCGDGPAQYEPASRGHHSHLLCRLCGRLYDLDPGIVREMQEKLRARYGFVAELENYPTLGVCADCRG